MDSGAVHIRARRVVLATGLVDDQPDVPGVEAAWCHCVLHCPFCHRWEVRDQRIAVLGRNENALHQVLLFRSSATTSRSSCTTRQSQTTSSGSSSRRWECAS